MNCDRCGHSGVCIFEEGAREFEKSYLELLKTKPAQVNVGEKVYCKSFAFPYQTRKPKKKADEK